ncbi:MAG TPA: response regulator transcription factor [Stellaceae bacterium]|jgi:DNA-binding NarL/FixJ family response regulator
MKVLIVEDHPIVRAGLRRLLAAEAGEEIREAASGQEALAVFKAWHPAVTVLDLNLPGLGGLGVIERLKAADPEAHILVLSMHDDPMHVTRALQAGAIGYVTKNAQPGEITDAVRRVAQGRPYVEHAIAQELVFSSLHPQPLPLTDLSTREIEVLRLLAQGRRLSEIAETVGISQKTAANSCSRIKVKLGAASTADLVRIALRSGLIDGDADLSSAPAR